jgi:hypothetical protein
MTKTWSRTEVTIESETLVVLRRAAGALRAWCGACGRESVMISPSSAASLAGVTTDVIYARVGAGLVHFNELPDGTLLICSASVGLNQT